MIRTVSQIAQNNGFTLDQQQIVQISRYFSLLKEWNAVINLTSRHDDQNMILSHLVDSLYINMYIITYRIKLTSCIDLGSGSGSLAFILKILNPNMSIGFLEADRRKINFIKQVVRDLGISNCHFYHRRAEEGPPEGTIPYDLAISRATWPVADYLRYAQNYVQNNGHIISLISSKQHASAAIGKLIHDPQWLDPLVYNIAEVARKRVIICKKK